jgi:hypothetical protein
MKNECFIDLKFLSKDSYYLNKYYTNARFLNNRNGNKFIIYSYCLKFNSLLTIANILDIEFNDIQFMNNYINNLFNQLAVV